MSAGKKKKKSTEKTLSPEEEAQKEDERMLSENKQDMEEILKFLEDGKDLEQSDQLVEDMRKRVGSSQKGFKVFHKHRDKLKIVLPEKTSNLVHLAHALEENMKLSKHGADMRKKLKRLAQRRIELLERVKKRGMF